MHNLRRFVITAVLLLASLVCWSQSSYIAFQATTFSATGQGKTVKLIGSAVTYDAINWTVTGAPAACNVQVDSSADGVTWNSGDVIASQSCTANGSATSSSFTANYIRVNVTALSANATLVVAWSGYATNPGGVGNCTISVDKNTLTCPAITVTNDLTVGGTGTFGGGDAAGSLAAGVFRWGAIVDTGAADAYAIAVSSISPTYAYAAGDMFCFSPAHSNATTTPTLNVNLLGAKTIIKQNGSPLIAGDIVASAPYCFKYDGSNFRIADPSKGLRVMAPTAPTDSGWPGAIALDDSGNWYAFKDSTSLWYRYAPDSTFLTLAAPSFSPGAGTYSSAQSVTETCTGPSVTGCYTTNGTTPTAGTPGTCDQSTYSTPISVASTETLKGLCTKASFTNSSVTTAAYTINSTPSYAASDSGVVGGAGSTTLVTTGVATTAGWNGFACVFWSSVNTVSGMGSTSGGAWTQIAGLNKTDGSASHSDCYQKTNVSGDASDKLTVTFSASQTYARVVVLYTESGTGAIDLSGGSTSAFSQTYTSSSFSTAQANEVILLWADDGARIGDTFTGTVGGNAATITKNVSSTAGASTGAGYYTANNQTGQPWTAVMNNGVGNGWGRIIWIAVK